MPRDQRSTDITSQEKASKHDDLMPLLLAMFREFQEAAKKKPEAALNKRKVEIVNRLLRDVISVVDQESTRTYLDLLDEDDLPQNSDVVLILGQAVAAMETFKEKYYGWLDWLGTHAWATTENTRLRTR
jgi:hypothetical protein